MNVITLASRKGGAGKTTLAAHLAALVHSQGHACLAVDGMCPAARLRPRHPHVSEPKRPTGGLPPLA